MPTHKQWLLQIIRHMHARHAGTDADTDAGTDTGAAAAINIWEQLARTFIPMIGPGGVSLIVARSVERNKLAYPWLPGALAPDLSQSIFGVLKICFEHRQAAEVIEANVALLDTFIDMMATLIGESLTIQFLRSAFPDEAIWLKPPG